MTHESVLSTFSISGKIQQMFLFVLFASDRDELQVYTSYLHIAVTAKQL